MYLLASKYHTLLTPILLLVFLPGLEDQGDVLVKACAMEAVENKQGECIKGEEKWLRKQFRYGTETKETWKLRSQPEKPEQEGVLQDIAVIRNIRQNLQNYILRL